MRRQQLVDVALLLDQGRAELHALARVRQRPAQRGLPGPEPERPHHQAGVAEDGVRLLQPLALLAAQQVVRRHDDVLEQQARGVRGADAVLVLVPPGAEPGRVALQHEEARPARRVRQDRVELRHAAVRDELLGAVEAVRGHGAARVPHRLGARLQGRDVAAGRRFRDAVGDDQALGGDPGQPLLALRLGAADQDRVGAEADRQERRGDPEVDGRHLLRDTADVLGAAAEAAGALGQEDQVEPHLGGQHGADDVVRELVGAVQLEDALVGKLPAQHLAQGLDHHVAHFLAQSGGCRHVSLPKR